MELRIKSAIQEFDFETGSYKNFIVLLTPLGGTLVKEVTQEETVGLITEALTGTPFSVGGSEDAVKKVADMSSASPAPEPPTPVGVNPHAFSEDMHNGAAVFRPSFSGEGPTEMPPQHMTQEQPPVQVAKADPFKRRTRVAARTVPKDDMGNPLVPDVPIGDRIVTIGSGAASAAANVGFDSIEEAMNAPDDAFDGQAPFNPTTEETQL